jgi:hypothetical protein
MGSCLHHWIPGQVVSLFVVVPTLAAEPAVVAAAADEVVVAV